MTKQTQILAAKLSDPQWSDSFDESMLEDVARSAYESANAYGYSLDVFMKLAREVHLRSTQPQKQSEQPVEVPDGVWEALQRLIENGTFLGPASQEDAMVVAKYRDRVKFIAAKPAQPVAKVDANDDEMWADVLPDSNVRVGQFLYAAAQPVEPTQGQIDRAKSASGSEQTPFEAGCEVLQYLREQGAQYYYTHRMLTCLHDKNEDEPKYRAAREHLVEKLREKCAALEAAAAQPVEVQRVPLTPDEIYTAVRPLFTNEQVCRNAIEISMDEYRAIEAAHGIKPTNKETK